MTRTITIGSWDGEEKQIQVDDNATVNDALRLAGVTISATQSVSSYSNAETVSLNSQVADGETYLLTANHISGI